MTGAVMRVVLTGFHPFAQHQTNISWQVAKSFAEQVTVTDPWSLQRESKLDDLDVIIDLNELSVDLEGSKVVSELLKNGTKYDAIIHLGLAEKSLLPRIERIAKDILDMRIEDNSGRKVVSATISGKGDLPSTIQHSYWKLENFSKRVIFSDDAGEFLCNETLYRTLDTIQQLQLKDQYERELPCLFLHLPLEDNYSIIDCREIVKDCIAHMLFPPVVEVAAALIENSDSFLIAKRIEGDEFENKWEFPGGKLELEETPFMAIEREIKEELAIDVRAVSHVGTWHHQLLDKEICLHLIKCQSENPIDVANTQSLTAHSQLAWHPIDELLEIEWIGSDKEIAQFLQR
ncbi:MAG: NUDIX domain-containing protein, partial [Candidatus Poseidoniales archaeon]|nr:NUDIX domain-containing protein [Candidatus Poseidoniales archaeon]